MSTQVRPIDANALMEFARNHVDHKVDCNDIARFPSLDYAPVVHAEWKTSNGVVRCSHCDRGYRITKYGPNTRTFAFCPNCGARME